MSVQRSQDGRNSVNCVGYKFNIEPMAIGIGGKGF